MNLSTMNKTTRSILPVAALCALLAGSSLAHADRSLAASFSDETLFFVETGPLTEIAGRWAESDIGELLRHEETRVFATRLLGAFGDTLDDLPEMDFEALLSEGSDALGLSEAEMRELFAGRLAFGVSVANPAAVGGFLEDGVDEEEVLRRLGPGLRLVLTHDGKQKLVEKAITHLRGGAEIGSGEFPFEKREVDGFTVFEPKEPVDGLEHGFLMFDDALLVVSAGLADVPAVIEEVRGGAARAFADTSIHPIGVDAMDGADVRVFARLGFLDGVLRQLLPVAMENAAQLVEGGMVAPPERILDLIRLDALRGFFSAIRVDGEAARYVSGLQIEERGGLVNDLLAYTEGGIPDLSFVPAAVTGVTVARYDAGAMLRAIDRFVPRISPMYGNMYEAYKGQLAAQSGVDLERMLFDNLTDEITMLSFEPTAAEASGVPVEEQLLMSSQVFVLSVRDGDRVVEGIDRLLAAFGMDGMLRKDEYLGASLYTSPMMAMQGQVAQQGLAVTRGHIVFGTGDLAKLRGVLSLLAEPNGGFPRHSAVKDYLDALGPDVVGFGHTDVRRALEGLAVSLRAGVALTGTMEDLPPVPDLSDFPLVFLSHMVKTGYGLKQVGVVRKVEE